MVYFGGNLVRINVDSDVSNVLKIINDNNYEAYLVGGFVRDALLGVSNDDYDICTNIPLNQLTTIFSDFKMMKENDRRQIGRLKINGKELEFVFIKVKL